MLKLEKNEHVESVIRKHWFILLRDVIGLVIIFILPIIAYIYIAENSIELTATNTFSFDIDPTILLFAVASWSLLFWTKLAGVWTDYYLDAWIITEKRIVDIEQKGLFHRQTSTFRMERIQDVTIEVNGIVATLLNFGDIHVQTAGESQEFVIKGISNPRRVRELILNKSDNAIRTEGQTNSVK
ncbi:PH domain-containing protein [Patescibacteria group bacterium]|nr:PH domain-containing protein [Patescibacteria group bacterium]